ncbi:MAG: alpha/beta hydrolase [Proteobacteria bacterium]|nr:alpha/beta hydrolase [Pseudomonadota bacterium]
MPPILFLPGSGASPDFWKPVGTRLPSDWPRHYFGWPGLGHQPHDPAINGFDDLIAMVVARITEPVDLVAQSMGGVIAARIALEHPRLVRRLVLTVTSGGVDMAGLGASDWRPAYRREYPEAAPWILEPRAADSLPIERIAAPTLLLWGDNDPISPVAVGQHLAQRLPDARLHVVKGGGHDLAETHAEEVTPLIERHLGR